MSATRGRRRKPPEIVVRGFEPGDVDAWARIEAGPGVFAGTLRSPFTTREELARAAAFDDRRRLLVAELGGEVVGVGALELAPDLRRRHAARLALRVDEAHQGRGVGGALLDALLELGARWAHVMRFEAEVAVDNGPAIALHRSRAFVVEGILRAHALRGGKLVDAFAMARVAQQLAYDRVTAEEVAQKRPPALPPGRRPVAEPVPGNGNGHGGARTWRWGKPPRDDE